MKIKEINKNGLYRSLPFDFFGHDPYWCRNWIFKVEEHDGIIYMIDTYFNDKCIELTDDNIHNFELLFDFDEVKEVKVDEYEKYDDEDRYIAAIGSGGWKYGTKYFVKMNAEYSKAKLIELLEYEIQRLEYKIKSNQYDLKCKRSELSKIKES